MTGDDKVLGLMIIGGLALCAYACVPRGNAFPTTGLDCDGAFSSFFRSPFLGKKYRRYGFQAEVLGRPQRLADARLRES